MTGSDMIHLAAAMVILVLTHIFCLAAMTERKYSIRKTADLRGVRRPFYRPDAGCFRAVWQRFC